jgi:predicted O-methyltransferase YrrM
VISRYRKGHGVHSPYVYSFVREVLFNKTRYAEYKSIDSIIAALDASEIEIAVDDLGGDSAGFRKKYRKVRDLQRISSVSSKYGRLLFRIARHYNPEVIIELGTSIGLSSIYLAKGNPVSQILTIEGNNELCNFAADLFRSNNMENIHLVQGDFDETIENLPAIYTCPHLVYIDGNHRYESTLRYFSFFLARMPEGIIIIDDINWSAGMRKAWHAIVSRNRKNVTIDLHRMGIVLISLSITPGHYLIRF